MAEFGSEAPPRLIALALAPRPRARYTSLDGQASFDDFVPFGGWRAPTLKRYAGPAVVCGATVKEDWGPVYVSPNVTN